jgi:hypothetical protein
VGYFSEKRELLTSNFSEICFLSGTYNSNNCALNRISFKKGAVSNLRLYKLPVKRCPFFPKQKPIFPLWENDNYFTGFWDFCRKIAKQQESF